MFRKGAKMDRQLSDDELRQALKKYGEKVGPITISTRSVWLKRLLDLRKNGSKRRSVDSGIESELSRRFGKNRSNIRSKSRKASNQNCSREETFFPDFDEFETPPSQHIPKTYSQKSEIDSDIFHRNPSYEEVELSEEVASANPYIYEKSLKTRCPSSARVATSTSNVLGMDLKNHLGGMNYKNYPPDFSHWNTVNNPKHHSSLYRNKLKQGDNSFVLENEDAPRKKVTKELQDAIIMTFMNKVWTTFLCFAVYNYLVIIPAILSLILNLVVLRTDHPNREFYEAVQHFLVIALMVIAVFIGLPLQFWAMKALKNILQEAMTSETFYCTEYIDVGIDETAGEDNEDYD